MATHCQFNNVKKAHETSYLMFEQILTKFKSYGHDDEIPDTYYLRIASIVELSRSLFKLLTTTDNYDVEINIGTKNNSKVFKSHSIILKLRSAYFNAAFSNEWSKKDNDVYQFKKDNISPELFEIILNYLYTGLFEIDHLSIQEILDLLIACDELAITDLLEYLQTYLVENHSQWIQENIHHIHNISDQHQFTIMKIYCDEILTLNPGIIFHPTNLNQLTSNSLKDMLGNNGLVMAEVEVWTSVVRWGISQVDEHLNKIDAYHWDEEDFTKLREVICDILPHIRFCLISTRDFYHYVAPFARVIGEETYHELLKYHLNTSYRPSPKIICPLGERTGQYGSVYFNQIFASLISSWIDNCSQIFYKRKITYDFKLLFKASRDGFKVLDFYRECSFVTNTLLLIKIKGYDNLIGGFNPNYWVDPSASKTKTGTYLATPYSFIFNLNKSSPQASILSRVASYNKATLYHPDSGPNFNDLKLCPSGFDNLQRKSVECHYFFTGFYYQNNIGLTNSVFQIENYEIFTLSKKTSRFF